MPRTPRTYENLPLQRRLEDMQRRLRASAESSVAENYYSLGDSVCYFLRDFGYVEIGKYLTRRETEPVDSLVANLNVFMKHTVGRGEADTGGLVRVMYKGSLLSGLRREQYPGLISGIGVGFVLEAQEMTEAIEAHAYERQSPRIVRVMPGIIRRISKKLGVQSREYQEKTYKLVANFALASGNQEPWTALEKAVVFALQENELYEAEKGAGKGTEKGNR
ncbi:hypothetical protein KY362_04045 [Candidatus Woesearchaeota archaeon]|nr:hypothetical protein [Candidatus Woesearchaeota archaeon]